MRRAFAMGVLVLGTCVTLCAEFAEEFQAARRQFDAQEYAASEQAFATLAAQAPNARGETAALSLAAIAAGRQGAVERGLDRARTIREPAAAAYAQMEILSDNRQHPALVEAFAQADIGAWPDRIDYKGFFLRGAAHARLGDNAAAADDFADCAARAGSDTALKIEAFNKLAVARHALGQPAVALEAYRGALAVFDAEAGAQGTWLYPQTIIGAAGILIADGEYAAARAILDRFTVKTDPGERGPWDLQVLEAYGDCHAAQGEAEQALTRYREAAAIRTHASYVARVQQKIESLGSRTEKPKGTE